MAPDGAEPCPQYTEMVERAEKAERELAEARADLAVVSSYKSGELILRQQRERTVFKQELAEARAELAKEYTTQSLAAKARAEVIDAQWERATSVELASFMSAVRRRVEAEREGE